MSNADSASKRQKFDRFLSSYQRIAFFLILPPLMSAFSAFVGLFNKSFKFNLLMSLPAGVRPILGEANEAWFIVIACSLVAVFVPLAILAAKGKLWAFLVGMGLYFADMVYGYFLFDPENVMPFVLNVALHAIFMGAFVFGLVFYIKADKLLKSDPKAIMGK